MNVVCTARYLRPLILGLAAISMVGAAEAQGRGRGGFGGGGHYDHGGGYRGDHDHRGGRGWGWGGVGLGLGLGFGLGSYYGYPWYSPAPQYTVVTPGVTYVQSQPVPAVPLSPPQPVIYPRHGQGEAQMDSDSNACSEWAGKQPAATSDPSIFQRAIAACMDARGYTLR